MDFDEAVKAHVFWKVTLRWMINGRLPLDMEKLGDDRSCELGRWIHGDGSRFKAYPAYAAMVREHALFHDVVKEVVRQIIGGDTESANRMLSPEGEFTVASARTIAAIRALEREIGQAQSPA